MDGFIASGREIYSRLVLVVKGRDSFGRILAHVVLEDGRDYGTEMMRRGLALPYTRRM